MDKSMDLIAYKHTAESAAKPWLDQNIFRFSILHSNDMPKKYLNELRRDIHSLLLQLLNFCISFFAKAFHNCAGIIGFTLLSVLPSL